MSFAKGKYAKAISDRSGMAFPYNEMVKEWNGALVHISEYEAKQPQLELKVEVADPEALLNSRTDRTEPSVPVVLPFNPFTTVASSQAFVNVFSPGHGRSTGDTVRFRGPTTTGNGSGNTQYASIPSFDGITDINSSSGFTITVGQKNSSGGVVTDTTSDYYHFSSSDTATSGSVSSGNDGCSAGPVTLEA
jgi:hypothetical protein